MSEVLRSVVTGVGGYLPADVVSNADLAKVKVEWRPTTILFTDGTRVGKE